MTATSSPHILIIDNDDDIIRAITKRLESSGYRCSTAGSGGQAISIFDEIGADLIITDLNMPNGDGITLVESIRERSNVPIIVVTGFSREYRSRLRDLPSVVCLRKPFDSNALIDLIETELMLAAPTQS